MPLKYCVTDWRGSGNWTAMQRRRRCDLQSVSNGWTQPAIAGVPGMVSWAWPSLLGDEGDPIVWNSNPSSILGTWTTYAVSQGWHLMDSGNGPEERLIYSAPPFSLYACDMRINACADALADHLLNWAPLSWLSGVHLDYYVNPVDLGATSFNQAPPNGWAGDQTFKDQWNAGIGRFADRLRSNRPDLFLIAQRDRPLVVGDPRLPAINGYFLEQYIGKFKTGTTQLGFWQIRQWIDEHLTYLNANHAGRKQMWIIEYGGLGQDIPGFPNTTALPQIDEVTGNNEAVPISITNRDEFLAAHIALCEQTGAYFSYDRDRKNQWAGHTPLPGLTTRVERVRPIGDGDVAQLQWGGAGQVALVNDQSDATGITSSTQNQTHLFTLPAPTLAAGENLLDVSIGMRLSKTGGTTTDTKTYWREASTNMSGRDHRLSTSPVTFYEENVAHPTGDWSNAAPPEIGVLATNSAGTRNALDLFADYTIETVGGPWGGIREEYVSKSRGGKIRPRRRRRG